jgi:hypothetical protein
MPPDELTAIGRVITDEVARQRALPPMPLIELVSTCGHAHGAAVAIESNRRSFSVSVNWMPR